jgi:hypothetical protein
MQCSKIGRAPPPKQILFTILLASLALQACEPAAVQRRSPNEALSPPSAPDLAPIPAPEILAVDDLMRSCPSAEKIALIDQQTEIIFLDDPTAPKLRCLESEGSADLTLLQKNVYNTLRVMQVLEFDLPLPWTDLQLFDWFTQAVNGIVFDPDSEFSQYRPADGMVVIQTEYLLATQTELWLSSYHSGAGVSSLLLLLAHEARHGEGYPHTCLTAVGKDLDLAYMGGWAVEYYLHLWIADHATPGFFMEYQREIARANSQLIRDTQFCGDQGP